MSLKKGLLALGIGLVCTVGARGAVIVEYNTTAALTSPIPADWTATTVDPSVSALQLTRGAGLTAAGLPKGFMATAWGTTDPSSGAWVANKSTADAVANGDYFQWGFTVDASHQVSISTLDLAMRRQSQLSPDRYEVLASTDGFATPGTSVASWTYLGRGQGTAGTVTPGQWMTTDTPGQDSGNPITQQDLSGASILQDIAPGTTVTFRLYGWYDGTGSPNGTLTAALGRQQGTNAGGPSLGGTITLVPEPAGLSVLAVVGLAGFRRRR